MIRSKSHSATVLASLFIALEEGSGVLSSERYRMTSYSLSFPPDQTSCLCAYDHGFKALVRKEKVALLDFEY